MSDRPSPQWPSPNFGERRGGVKPSLIILHYTAMKSAQAARARLCDPEFEVSAHWLIGEDGTSLALVPEEARAWHAGRSYWRGIRDVNSHSIGIELANPGNHPFPEPQMAALEHVLAGIMARWQIAPQGVLAHSDIAPDRKIDPGPHFDWQRLARQGLALAPSPVAAAGGDFTALAHAIGYDPGLDAETLLGAFRLRFRPWGRGAVTAQEIDLAQRVLAAFPAGFPVDGAGAGA
ncbi:N-acetylmuramoyl-L-alanine amidase [Pseudogemmobacter bohemicus]|uniref:N-acetylmuramoyl-L-alanine amidase n=1 Tax=Pseudogemmobacter bohemicus TaxID=2250708 RepID=UPI001E49E245|nr:N-acetylmuramoyl-L-alanine amidase [Pseudogemmobacter bohemicus]